MVRPYCLFQPKKMHLVVAQLRVWIESWVQHRADAMLHKQRLDNKEGGAAFQLGVWGLRKRRRRVRKKQSQRKWDGEVLKRRSKDNRKWWWGKGWVWISVSFWRVAAMSSHGSLVLEDRSATLPKEPRRGRTGGGGLALLSPTFLFFFPSFSGCALTPQITVAALNPPISKI